MHSILAIKQEDTVTEYQKKFEVYFAPLSEFPKTVLENTFLNGLKPDLKAAVVSRQPVGLEEIMLEAQLIEDRDLAIQKACESNEQRPIMDGKINPNSSGKSASGGGFKSMEKKVESTATRSVTLPDKGILGKRDLNHRKMTDVEFQTKREKGLCFKCDEKFSPGHRCKSREVRELRVVLVNGADEIEIVQGNFSNEEPKEIVPEVSDVELDLKSVIGFCTLGTMKLMGKISEREVLVLIDCT